MNRRKFLSTGAVTGVLLRAGRAQEHKPKPEAHLSPDDLAHAPGLQQTAFPLEEITVTELQLGIQQGKLTAEHVVELYLERIQQIDVHGPALRSVIETNPEAIAIA